MLCFRLPLKAALLATSCFMLAALPAGALTSQQKAQVDEVVNQMMDEQKLVGLAIGLIEKGEITYQQGYGWANQAKREAVSLDSRFRWASLSKSVTAVLSLQLAEQGKLDLDQDIRTYDPIYRNGQNWTVTQRQLLAHTSGIGSYDEVTGWKDGLREYHKSIAPKAPWGVDMSQASRLVFGLQPLQFRPGSQYHYTTFGYMQAGAVLEQVNGIGYLQQFDERIRQPLKLNSTWPDTPAQYLPHRVQGYHLQNQQITPREKDDVAWKLAGGGFSSNIQDLTRYTQALLRQELLKPASNQAMWTPQNLNNGKSTGYGLGLGISSLDNQLKLIHTGAQTQTRTLMSFVPARQLGVAIMCNSEWAELGPLEARLLKLLQSATDTSIRP